MKLIKQLLTTAVTCLTTTICLTSAAPANASVELTFLDSQIQCGPGASPATIHVDVHDQGTLVAQDMAISDSVTVSGINNVTMTYRMIDKGNADPLYALYCDIYADNITELIVVEESDIPNLPGAEKQDSIRTILSNTKSYEDLWLVEIGGKDNTNIGYDFQDIVFIVNNSPSSTSNTNAQTPLNTTQTTSNTQTPTNNQVIFAD